MAKTNKANAESKTTQPAPAEAADAPTAARGNGRQADDIGPQSDGDEALMAFAEQEAGIGESDEAPSQVKKPKAAKPEPVAAVDDESDDDADDPETEPDDRLPDGEVEGDADEPEDGAVSIPGDDDDGPGTSGEGEDDENPKGERRLSDLPEWAQQEIRDKIKLREQRRELRAQIEAQTKELTETRKKLEAAATGYTAAVPGFEQVKSPEEFDALRERLQADMDWAEDYADGYEGQDANGAEVVYTRQQMREFKAKVRERIRLTEKAKETLTKNLERSRESEEKARKLYPSFLDPKHPRANLLLDAAQQFPELNASPSKALLLAKVAVAGLLESGAYKLVKVEKPKGKQPAAAQAAARVSTPKPPPVPVPPRPSARSAPDLADRLMSGDDHAKEEWAMGLIGD